MFLWLNRNLELRILVSTGFPTHMKIQIQKNQKTTCTIFQVQPIILMELFASIKPFYFIRRNNPISWKYTNPPVDLFLTTLTHQPKFGWTLKLIFTLYINILIIDNLEHLVASKIDEIYIEKVYLINGLTRSSGCA